MSLEGKRVVLVGGTSGMGFATAAAAAAEGASVVVASRDPERVAAAVAKLPPGSEGKALDITSELAVADFFEEIGAFDHLVHTAGLPPAPQELAAIDLAAERAAIDLSFWGLLNLAKHAGPKIQEGGSIVLTSGSIGARPRKGFAISAGIIGAIEGLTRGLAVELAPVRVNAVAPGVIRTEMWEALPADELEGVFKTLGDALLTGRVGYPAEIAEANLSLMRNGFVTGAVVPVDGGVRFA